MIAICNRNNEKGREKSRRLFWSPVTERERGTCAGAGGAGAAEALLLDDETDAYEGGGGDREECTREVGGEEVAAGVWRGGSHRRRAGAAARGRRIWGGPRSRFGNGGWDRFFGFFVLEICVCSLENALVVPGVRGRS